MSSRNQHPKARSSVPAATQPKRTFWLVRWVWIAVVLVWPLLKWVISVSAFFQGLRAIYYWNDPTVLAGWSFLAHFAVLTVLTYFVSVFKPKGI